MSWPPPSTAAAAWARWPTAGTPPTAGGAARWLLPVALGGARGGARACHRHARRARPLAAELDVARRGARRARRLGQRLPALAARQRARSCCRSPRWRRCSRRCSTTRTAFPSPARPGPRCTSRSRSPPTRSCSSPRWPALLMTGLEKRLHRGLPAAAGDGTPPLLTLERYLFRLIAAGFVLLSLTLASRRAVLGAGVRAAVQAHPQEPVLGARLAHLRGPARRALALRLARAPGPRSGSSPVPGCWCSPTSAASSCSRCCCSGSRIAAAACGGRKGIGRVGDSGRTAKDANIGPVPAP